jgi:predicted membrane protein
MNRNNKPGFAFLLIGLGVVILLGKFAIGFLAGLMGYLIPILMIALGYYGVKNGSRFFGWVIMILGVLILFSKMAWIFGLLLAIGLIVLGASMLSNKRNNRPY